MLNYRRDNINRWHRLGCGVLLMRSRRIKRPWWDTTVSCRFQRWLIQFSNVEVLQVFVCRFLPRWKMVQASSWWFMQYILYLVRFSVYAIVTPLFGSQINHFLRSPHTREQSLAGDFHFFIILTKTLQNNIYISIYIYLHWHIHLYNFIHNIVCNTNFFWYRRLAMTWQVGIIRVNFVRTCGASVSSSFCGMSTFFFGSTWLFLKPLPALRFLRLPAPLPNVLCRPSWKHSGVQGHVTVCSMSRSAVGQVMSKLSFFGGPCKNK